MKKHQVEPFDLIGISVRTTNKNGQGMKDIGGLWGRFFSENIPEKIPNKISSEIYTVYTDYEGDFTQPYTTIIGCKVENLGEIPEGMIGKSFEGGNYLHLTAKGDIHQGLIGNKWNEIWNSDLKRRYTADFEIYGKKAENSQDAEVDFFIAVNE